MDFTSSCLACAGSHFTTADIQSGHRSRTLLCSGCGLGFQDILPDEPLGIYRRAEYDRRRTQCGHALGAWSRFRHDRTVALSRLRQLSGSVPPPPATYWYDYGCGNGGFLSVAREAGYLVAGIELDEEFCREVTALTGIPVLPACDFLPPPVARSDAPREFYHSNPLSVSLRSVVSLFDVLEHLVDPSGVLLRCVASAMADCVVLEVPDLAAHQGPIDTWEHFKPDEHLTHWSGRALEALRSRLFPQFLRTHESTPVPGKLQVVWRKKGLDGVD